MPRTGWPSPRSPAARALRAALPLIALSTIAAGGCVPELPGLPAPKPRWYRTHIPKAERRGRAYAELQAMRAQRCR